MDDAVRAVRDGTPVVLVGSDAAVLGEVVSSAPDHQAHERLLAVVVGDPQDPAVMLAADEMAGELWQWANASSSKNSSPEASEEASQEGL